MATPLTQEQLELGTIVRRMLTRRSQLDRVRSQVDSDADPDDTLWHELSSLGLLALNVPEEHGGVGGSMLDVAVVAHELGRFLAAPEFLATVGLAVPALVAVGTTRAQADYLPRLVAGDLTATLCENDQGTFETDHDAPVAVLHGGAWQLSGRRKFVLCADADLLLVVGIADGEPRLFAVEREAAGLQVALLPGIDRTRAWGHVTFHATPAQAVDSTGTDVVRALYEVWCTALVVVAAELAGVAARTLEASVEYALVREQFGRPIGTYQAVKHRCADMLVRAQGASSAAFVAAAHAGKAGGRAEAISAALYATDAAFENASANIMVHGGIGFTWEHDAHFYFKRAQGMRSVLGTCTTKRLELLRTVADDPSPTGNGNSSQEVVSQTDDEKSHA